MAQAVVQLGVVKVEILVQKVIGGEHIRQCNTQATTVFLYPIFQRSFLTMTQAAITLLVNHQPLMGHGADQGQVEFVGQ
ncbi:hypothetical protein D3C72_1111360 [compost metagenome]